MADATYALYAIAKGKKSWQNTALEDRIEKTAGLRGGPQPKFSATAMLW